MAEIKTVLNVTDLNVTDLDAADFTLTDTSWEDIRIPVTSFKLGASADPDFEVFRKNTGGTSQGVFAYAFDKTGEEELYFAVQLPHNYKLGTDLYPHVHYATDTVPAGGTTVQWGLEYTMANFGDAFPVTNTITTAARTMNADEQYEHIISAFTSAIDGSGIDSVSTMLICRVYRNVAGDDYDDDIFLLEVDLHYEVDSLGSDSEYTK